MNICKILGLSFGISLSYLAVAAQPLTSGSLATVDAVISVCRDAAPADDGAYNALRQSVTGAQSRAALDQLTGAADYQQTYVLIRGALAQIPRDALRTECYAAIGKNDHRGGR